ncbi:MAG: hypothetical protein P0Y53_04775 [Candidatus Pseudobacter hemicellulosilyticus]|uniref:PAP2 superfamily protein n=1 Tax=Candidatus Pseudobacter hemicellulosilyticus TaxID=3121375 RepID=A0AAJ5WWF0_9BACT|nr:MAG: hypothetical protein P0Y53_04775 [Pseudobacter sp.]
MENIYSGRGLSPATPSYRPHWPAAVRAGAHVVSFIFHPLFIPVYVYAFLAWVHPYAFAAVPQKRKIMLLMAVFFSTGFLPMFSVLLMKGLGFIQSIFLRTQRERIIPYAAAIIFYFWIWYVFRNLQDIPGSFVNFLLGSFLGVCAAWLFNIRNKISMHGTGVGGLMMYFLIRVQTAEDNTALFLSAAILITGLVCTARFIVSDHTRREVYSGLIAGMVCQLIAWVI